MMFRVHVRGWKHVATEVMGVTRYVTYKFTCITHPEKIDQEEKYCVDVQVWFLSIQSSFYLVLCLLGGTDFDLCRVVYLF